jgi:hypothetical protein
LDNSTRRANELHRGFERLTANVESELAVVEDGDKLAVVVYTKRQWHDGLAEMVEETD